MSVKSLSFWKSGLKKIFFFSKNQYGLGYWSEYRSYPSQIYSKRLMVSMMGNERMEFF